MKVSEFLIKLYLNSANLDEMKTANSLNFIGGVSTNISLLKDYNIKNYPEFIENICGHFDKFTFLFPLISDNFEEQKRECDNFKKLNKDIFIKIPVLNSKGESNLENIKSLSKLGYNLNVTAVFTLSQVEDLVGAFSQATHNIISFFAGSLLNSGVNISSIVKKASRMSHALPGVELLWEDAKSISDIIVAQNCDCDIVSFDNNLLEKFGNLDKTPLELCLNEVKENFENSKYINPFF